MFYYADNNVSLERATPGSAGFDLTVQSMVFGDDHAIVGTGVYPVIPHGMVGLVFERSSLYKHGWWLANSVGVIDSDYRGEIKLVLEHLDEHNPLIEGQRVAQLVLVPCFTGQAQKLTYEQFTTRTTVRGDGGFGSTGDQ